MKKLRLIVFLYAMLLASFVNAQTWEIFYYPKLIKLEPDKAKAEFASLIYWTSWGKPENVTVFDNRIEMTFKGKKRTTINHSIYFSEMASHPVGVSRIEVTPVAKSVNATITYFNYRIGLKDGYLYAKTKNDNFFYKGDMPAPSFTFADSYSKENVPATESNFEKLADYLFFFQHPYMIQHYDSLLTQFKPVAEQYRALKVKSPVSEEQRKYIVQANMMNKNKDYEKAVDLYNKALELNQTAYPEGYSNLALLSAQINNFDGAIFYMKEYLLLEPEASDARSAQDKIYEWEAMVSGR
jgi:tetratricopeptide (TPR) repeat protein